MCEDSQISASDFFAGVRAGLNGMDVGQFENALADTVECDTHPGGADRVEAIEAGVEYAKAYFNELKGFMSSDQITHTPEESSAHPSFGCTRK